MQVRHYTLFTDHDIKLFRNGKHFRLYEKLGCHDVKQADMEGTYFAVWAPNAKKVSLIGEFNDWNPENHKLFKRNDGSGIWEGLIKHVPWGILYKYEIETTDGTIIRKSDPFALSWEQNSNAASLVSTNWYLWSDKDWMQHRKERNNLHSPISVYELQLGSWQKSKDNNQKFLNYREIASKLVPYIKEMGFTHVEFMPIMEYPYDPSWGYQITGFYAVTSRFGSPQDCMYLINELHRNGIGVILDWVPSHFPGDENGLLLFDGKPLYEYADPKKGFHPEWKSYIFDYGKNEVRSFLISNALFWLDRFHADGLRVDAVTSMLHLDYARGENEWTPNILGGNVNLEAKKFLQDFNTAVHENYPDTITIAEESSDFPLLTHSVKSGGVGFDMKWMMGWMHDTLKYFKEEFEHRKYHHHKITFSTWYAFNEKYMMPLSHDEVVHGKSSLIYKMKGDEWQKFANLRVLFTMMFTFPGTKLLFMGNEFGQTSEWNFLQGLQWDLLQHPIHKGLQETVKTLNHFYTHETSLFEKQFEKKGFEWLEADDEDNSIYIYLRKGKNTNDTTLIMLNLTPEIKECKVGCKRSQTWEVLFNSDDKHFGGSGVAFEILKTENTKWKDFSTTMTVKLPPLSGVILKAHKK